MERAWCRPGPAAELLLKGGRVVDPGEGIDGPLDVLIRKGVVAELGSGLEVPKGVRAVDAGGLLVLPGFVDLHAHLRTPGREDEEDIESGTRAAAAGGYVAVFGMANTDPVVDTAAVLAGLVQRAQSDAIVRAGFFAAATRGLGGEHLTEMAELADTGAVGFSDDGRPLASTHVVRRALQYAKLTGRPIAVHAEDAALVAGGQMHEGPTSARLGLDGIPAIAESIDVQRVLEVAAYEDARVHLCHLSAAASLEHVERAKKAGVRVTAEVTPHHLTMTDSAVETFESAAKMNPPLREESDRTALLKALKSGIVDCVATDHAPHAPEEEDVPFEEATFGTTGLETAFAVLYTGLVKKRALPLGTLVARMSAGPAAIAGIEAPAVRVGARADLCVIDADAVWTVTRDGFQSRSSNSAWLGRKLTGKVRMTLAAGRLAWEADA